MEKMNRENTNMNTNYVKHAWQDHEKVNDFAVELMKKLDIGSELDFNSWRLEDNKFCIIVDDRDCGGSDVWYFPIEWLDYDVEKICDLWFAEKEKSSSKLIG